MRNILFRSVLTSFIIMVVPSSYAHDFWLSPNKYKLAKPNAISVQFLVGHKEDMNHWDLQWKRIVALRAYSENKVSDMTGSVIPKTNLLPGTASTKELAQGTHLIGFETYHSISELNAEKFNSYISDEGLTAISKHRQEAGTSTQRGTEIYSRRAKAIVQVGDTYTDNVTQPIGHTLEIVPLHNPHSLKKDEELPIVVLFRGKPLAGALVHISSLNNHDYSEQFLTTESTGITSFQVDKANDYKINVIWGVPIANNADADYETYFSSLTFGY
ncbi:MAG: DUF4198 domain-containing protein [Glaciecola sp.]